MSEPNEPTIAMLPLASLIEDWGFYPRHVIDDVHVGNMVAALVAGVTLPPPVADKASKRLIDGWHRVRAYKRHLGAEAVIEVLLRDFKGDEGAMLLAAVAANASHGRKLDRVDQQRCIILAEERKIPLGAISKVLNMPLERVERLRVHVAYAGQPGSPGTVTNSFKVPLKRPLRHMDGMTLTPSQLIEVDRAPGTSYLLLCQQITGAANEHLLNPRDGRLVEALRVMVVAVQRWLDGLPKDPPQAPAA